MDFFKRHYEKVILLGLFALFIGLMIFVQGVISSTGEVKPEDLALPEREADHVVRDPNAPEFDTVARWQKSRLEWPANVDRDHENEKGVSVFSDFVSVFPMAVCPYCKEDTDKGKGPDYNMLIPFDNFSVAKDKKIVKKGVCPQCGHELPPPMDKSEAAVNPTDADRDGDGIPNDVETKFGMNPDDPNDALYDSDGDGFSNLFEIQNNTKPNDSADHPPIWWRLFIKDIRQVELPIKFMALNDNGNPTDKNMWSLQFNHPDPRRPGRITSSFRRIGQSLKIEGRDYVISDIERRTEQRKKQGGALTGGGEAVATEALDVSRVFLTERLKRGASGNPDKLVMVVNQTAYSSDKRPVFCDSGDLTEPRPEYVLKVGDTISLGLFNPDEGAADVRDSGKKQTSAERHVFRLKEVDSEKMILRMELVETTVGGRRVRSKAGQPQEVVEITREGKIPVKMFPVKKKDRQTAEMAPDGDDLAIRGRNR